MENEKISFLKRFLAWLSSTPKVGALHIQGTVVTYLRLGGAAEAFSVKMEPGALQDGKIIDRAKMLVALKELAAQAGSDPKKESLRVVVVMPSEPVYTQGVNIPNVGKDRLEESASLNLQMVSPMNRGEATISYEVVEEAEDHYELLGVFVERRVVEELRSVLEEAGFQPIIFEFSSLALTRLIERVKGVYEHATLGFYLSSDGLEFFIVKRGKLHFSYFRSWASIQGVAREISRELFDEVVTREVQKVVNFSLGKFKERPREVVLIAQGFAEEVNALLSSRFEIPVTALEVGGGFTSPWFAVLGAALRAKGDPSMDVGINLATTSSHERLFEEQAFGFIKLWRSILAGVLVLFLAIFGASAYFLMRTQRNVAVQIDAFTARSNTDEFAELSARAREFNALVRATVDAVATRVPWQAMLRTLERVMGEHGVALDRIEARGQGNGITLTARAPSNDRLISFKNALVGAEGFTDVNLSVAQIATLEDGSVGFTVTFTYIFPER